MSYRRKTSDKMPDVLLAPMCFLSSAGKHNASMAARPRTHSTEIDCIFIQSSVAMNIPLLPGVLRRLDETPRADLATEGVLRHVWQNRSAYQVFDFSQIEPQSFEEWANAAQRRRTPEFLELRMLSGRPASRRPSPT